MKNIFQAPENTLETTCFPIAGIRIGVTSCGIKTPGRVDLCVIEIAPGSHIAAVFTRNAFCAAPVQVAREHLKTMPPRYLVINTGNANAGTGDRGLADARQTCEWIAAKFGVEPQAVLPFSTGVIGQTLPMAKLQMGIETLADFKENNWLAAAHAIMTTDTRPKIASRKIMLSSGPINITGIAKGAGMICPNMATMLAFIATDAELENAALQQGFQTAVQQSFNSITIDGDTSTNDACVFLATGKSGIKIASESEDWALLQTELTSVCIDLAQQIVRDGEGATKFISIRVQGGRNPEECRQVAYNIAHSPLVKTAFFASDANWGRILAAVGRTPLEALSVQDISIYLDDVCVIARGQPAPEYTEAAGSEIMARTEILLRIELGRGNAHCEIWTCDLSHDYVRINAEYRS